LFEDPTGVFIGHIHEYCLVEAVIIKKHVEAKSLENQKEKEVEIPPDKQDDVTHLVRIFSFLSHSYK
jgi:hypothetical protein